MLSVRDMGSFPFQKSVNGFSSEFEIESKHKVYTCKRINILSTARVKKFKGNSGVVKEMTWWLGTGTTLTEDQSSVPRIYLIQFTIICHFGSMESKPSSRLCRHVCSHMYNSSDRCKQLQKRVINSCSQNL